MCRGPTLGEAARNQVSGDSDTGKPPIRLATNIRRRGRSGVQGVGRCRQLSVLQHQGQLSDFLLQLIAFGPELTQLVTANGNVQSLWNACW